MKRAQRLEDEPLNDINTFIKDHLILKEDYQRFLNISDIGEKTALSILTLFNTYQSTNRVHITALVGLDLIKRELGISVKGKIRISKNGNKHIRKMFYMPTLCAIKNNQNIFIFDKRSVSIS